jgi:ABC-type proline/glycine betaine transport system substrate-binding protein
VNGKELDLINQDVATILQQVLEELGYDVEIIETYNGE